MESYEGALTTEQTYEMLHVTYPDGQWARDLHPTPEIEAAYRSWLTTDCQHDEEPELRRKIIKGGGVQYVKVCSDCGCQFGGPIAKKDVPNPEDLPLFESSSEDNFRRRRYEDWRDQKIIFYARQALKVSKEYAAYLESPGWRSKSKRVIQRAGGICEGCGEAEATQAHHISYEHRMNEFLWELVAICEACHIRAHPEKHGKAVGND